MFNIHIYMYIFTYAQVLGALNYFGDLQGLTFLTFIFWQPQPGFVLAALLSSLTQRVHKLPIQGLWFQELYLVWCLEPESINGQYMDEMM